MLPNALVTSESSPSHAFIHLNPAGKWWLNLAHGRKRHNTNFLSLVYINVGGSVITMSGCVVSNLEIFHKLLEMSGSPPVPSICLNKNQWYAAIIYRALAFSSKSLCLSTVWHKPPAVRGFFSPRLSTHGKKTYILPTLLAKYTFLDHQQTAYKYVHPFLLFLLSCFANAGKNSRFWILALRQVLGELLWVQQNTSVSS